MIKWIIIGDIELNCSIFFVHCRVITVEVDPVQGCIARHHIDLAGLSCFAELWTGQFRDILPRPVEEFGARSLGLAFLDYKGTIFHEDLATMEGYRPIALLAPMLKLFDKLLQLRVSS